MAENDIGSAIASDLTSAIKDFSVASQSTDAAQGAFTNKNWPIYLGYYKDEKTPTITAIIDTHTRWATGNGYEADEITTMLLDTIKGNGFDTFISILEDGDRVMQIGGNFYAEIIRDDDDVLINLKPLEPGVMEHVTSPAGIITGFKIHPKT